jgi:hypothetical protein
MVAAFLNNVWLGKLPRGPGEKLGWLVDDGIERDKELHGGSANGRW